MSKLGKLIRDSDRLPISCMRFLFTKVKETKDTTTLIFSTESSNSGTASMISELAPFLRTRSLRTA
jgi:hypothetical protein